MNETPDWVFPTLLLSSLFCIVASVIALSAGVTIIFQNLFYVPIIIACIYFLWRGFGFSVLLSVIYLFLFFVFIPDQGLVREAAVRVLIFIGIALVVTLLSAKKEKSDAERAAAEEQYRTVVRDQSEFICRFLPDGTHVFVNEAYCRYFGLNKDEVIGSRFKPEIHPEDIDKVTNLITSLTPECPTGAVVQRTLNPDGTIFWQRWNTRAIFDEDGVLCEYQSVGRDTTLQKEAEAKLRRTKEYLQKLFDHAGAPIVVWNPDLVITRFNHAFSVLTGIPEAEALCSHVSILFPECSRESAMEIISGAMRGERMEGVELQVISRMGDPRSVLWNSASIMGDDGKTVVATVAHGQDITGRKIAEESYRTLFSEMTDGFALFCIVYDDGGREVDYRYLAVNHAYEEMMGLRSDEVLGNTVLSLHSAAGESWIEAYTKGAAGKMPALFEKYSSNLDKYFLVRAFSPGKDQVACIFTDITEKKKAEEIWKMAFDQIEENMYRLSILNDQVRNPLAIITGIVDLHGDEHAETILREVQEINRIVTLLDQGLLDSEAIRAYMRKHRLVSDWG